MLKLKLKLKVESWDSNLSLSLSLRWSFYFSVQIAKIKESKLTTPKQVFDRLDRQNLRGRGMGQAFRKLFDTFFGNTEMRVPFPFLLSLPINSVHLSAWNRNNLVSFKFCVLNCIVSVISFRLWCLVLTLLAKQLYSTSCTLVKFYLLFLQLVGLVL